MRWQMSDSVYVSSYRPGAVVNQNPEPNSRVKRNRNVFLIINALAPERVSMPSVVGVSYRQAKSTLEQNGLIVGQITLVPYMFSDFVIRQMYRGQEIRRGTEIVKGSEIELVIGQVRSERIPVPSIIGNTHFEARENLTKYLLNFGVIIYDNTVVTSADSVRAFVYQQRPAASPGATIQLGSSVDVWLTIDESRNPNLAQQSENE
jgi:beta-lactam-binding protein with PASTA domain